MRNYTRALFDRFTTKVALLSGVASAAVTFSVAPVVAQTLEQKIQHSSDFLSKVNFVTVTAQEGDKVGVGVTRPIAGRTNTAAGNRRTPMPATDTTDEGRYRCEQTNFDHAIKYATLDAWAHRPEFQTMIRDAIVKRQGLDRMIIGWNGTSVAAQTDRVANPMLQDVNKGWLHKIRTFAAARVLADGDHTDGATKAIYVANKGTADYVNLDSLVFDAIEMLDEWNRDDTELVAIVGRDLVHDRFFGLVEEAGEKPTEQLARDVILSTKKIGGLTAVRVPFFPAGTVLVTRLDNLSIYAQEGTRRRLIKDEPALDQVENYESVNEAYVVEDYGYCALIENIVMGAEPGSLPDDGA